MANILLGAAVTGTIIFIYITVPMLALGIAIAVIAVIIIFVDMNILLNRYEIGLSLRF